MSTRSRDFYEVLGVKPDADSDAIRKAYRKLAKQYHPDANPGDESAQSRFQEIGEAYAVLSDEEKRKKYDQMRRLGAFGLGGEGGERPRWSSESRGPGSEAAGGFAFEDLGAMGGLGDLFSSIFDRGRRGRTEGPGAAASARGRDVELQVEITFEVAARGGKVTLRVPVTEDCTGCGGSGAAPGTGTRICSECGGSGAISFGQGGFAVNRPCPACVGRGRVPESPCRLCQGSGMVRQRRKLEVRVPAGVETGSRLKVSGKGERTPGGGPPGDLILVFKVKDHRFFTRDGLDVHVQVPINLAQAVLGSRVKVRTLEGKHVVLRIPPGTQSGTRFRLRGQGVNLDGKTGDQFVEVRIEVPTSLSDEERERFEAFAEAAGLRH
ncbi:MAG: molecular chaperone DnaJ [Gemmatimonadales bacterium]|nr:MAG: molecular chaperone DnaJ [Gemmatimonadales bacterium]